MMASPAAMPSDPPMKSKSCTAITVAETVELAVAEFHRIGGPGLAARILQAVNIAAFVAKPQRVDWHFGQCDVEPGLVVEHRFEPRGRSHAHVVVGAGDDELVRFDILVENELAGLRTFDPEILRHLAAEYAADFRTDDV